MTKPNFNFSFSSQEITGPGYLFLDTPPEVEDEIQELLFDMNVGKEMPDPMHEQLAGHISREDGFEIRPNLKYLVESLAVEYDKVFYNNIGPAASVILPQYRDTTFYVAEKFWINYQRKTEFNPVHSHSGAYSYVIWLQIPYNLDEEVALYNTSFKEGSVTSDFLFYYTSTDGIISSRQLFIDKKCAWKMVFFPASMHHAVYPFYTSDDDRISLAGNVYIDYVDPRKDS